MRGNKGFTLVELLAVLVILAIIALITTPIILGVIEDARKSGAEDKTWAYVDAVENAFALNQASSGPVILPLEGVAITKDIGEGTNAKKIRVSGDTTDKGTYSITANGIVTVDNLVFDGYTCSTNNDATKVCCDKKTSGTVECS